MPETRKPAHCGLSVGELCTLSKLRKLRHMCSVLCVSSLHTLRTMRTLLALCIVFICLGPNHAAQQLYSLCAWHGLECGNACAYHVAA